MEAFKLRNIRTGVEYDRYFPKPPGHDHTIKKSASLDDTVAFIPKVVKQTIDQTSQIAQRELKGRSVYETCKKIWHFVYQHIQYRKDEQGYEQIRSPRRTWHDRKKGVDCDCYSVFISSILTNLGIPHVLRITKYNKDYFQHIYPIVPHAGRYITIDCVTDRFDYEVPYSEKKDYKMELQFLDGLPSDGMDELNNIIKRNLSSRQPYATDDHSLGLFGKKKKKKAAAAAAVAASAANPAIPGVPPPPPPKKKKKGFLRKLSLRKVLNVVNKINPATVLLRNGLLLAMKMNVKNVAKRIRWGYLTPQQAAAKNMDAAKHQRLVATKDKMEKIFEGAGGKPSNLRKAILGGKGNKDKAVQGLDGLGMIDFTGIDRMDFYTPLPELLGPEIYHSENVEGFNGREAFEGLGELGEPVTLATVGAAMGVISGIVASLKQIGNIFKGKGEPGSEDFDEAVNEAAENNQPVPDTTPVPATATQPIIAAQPNVDNSSYSEGEANNTAIVESNSLPATADPGSSETETYEEAEESDTALTKTGTQNNLPAKIENKVANNTPDDKQSFWGKNKTWIKPVAIIGGSIALIAISVKVLKSERAKNKSSPPSLSGIPKGRRKNYQRKKKHKHSKQVAVALL